MSQAELMKANLMKVIVAPCFSEKASRAADQGKSIAFEVLPCAGKTEIKNAVELLFEVEVDSVRTVNVKGKKRRFGRIEGSTKAWKKAYVKLKPGHDISFGEAAE